jgi:plasmid stabilization system protein ParE
MAKPISFLPAARKDIAQAYDWYESRKVGLGLDFLVELDRLVERIIKLPQGYERVAAEFRRGILSRFPYSLYYEVMADRLIVYGVFHHSDDPAKWQSRLKDD